MVLFFVLALIGLPPEATVVGTIEVAVYLDGSGSLQTAYGFEGMDKDAAIGKLLVTTDRMRKEREYEWGTCPDCKRPWAEHFEDEEDDA